MKVHLQVIMGYYFINWLIDGWMNECVKLKIKPRLRVLSLATGLFLACPSIQESLESISFINAQELSSNVQTIDSDPWINILDYNNNNKSSVINNITYVTISPIKFRAAVFRTWWVSGVQPFPRVRRQEATSVRSIVEEATAFRVVGVGA